MLWKRTLVRLSGGSSKLTFHLRAVGFSPLPEKLATGGEDAYISTSSVQAVLDGVSWWRDNLSVDAGLYSAALAKHMYEYVEDDLLGDVPASSLRLLQRGYELSKHGKILGTSTALVATLQNENKKIQDRDGYQLIDLAEWQREFRGKQSLLSVEEEGGLDEDGEPLPPPLELSPTHAANRHPNTDNSGTSKSSSCSSSSSSSGGEGGMSVGSPPDSGAKLASNYLLDVAYVGDCGLLIIRNGRILFETEEQQHDTDYPFQLGDGSADTPKDGVRLLIPVQRGDIVVMGSDGILDNVYTRRICQLLWRCLRDSPFFASDPSHTRTSRGELLDETLTALNKGIEMVIAEAIAVSKDIRADSPYATRCIENGANFEGGKPDDMTILAAILEDEESAADMERVSEGLFPPPYRDWP